MMYQVTISPATPVFAQHGHCVEAADQNGNGRTSNDAGHAHQIVGWRVVANPQDGHSHQVANVQCNPAMNAPPPNYPQAGVAGPGQPRKPCGGCNKR